MWDIGVIYAHTSAPIPLSLPVDAIEKLLASVHVSPKPKALWSMHYQQAVPRQPAAGSTNDHTVHMPGLPPDLVLEDDVLKDVRAAWDRIVGEDMGRGFITFEDREAVGGGAEDDE